MRGEGFRTPETTLSFKVLSGFSGGKKMAPPERFELPTNRFEAGYSIQLSYGGVVEVVQIVIREAGPRGPLLCH